MGVVEKQAKKLQYVNEFQATISTWMEPPSSALFKCMASCWIYFILNDPTFKIQQSFLGRDVYRSNKLAGIELIGEQGLPFQLRPHLLAAKGKKRLKRP